MTTGAPPLRTGRPATSPGRDPAMAIGSRQALAPHQAGRLTKLLLRVVKEAQRPAGERTFAVAAVLTQAVSQLQDLRSQHLADLALIEGLLGTLGPKVTTLRQAAERQLELEEVAPDAVSRDAGRPG